MRQIMKYTLPPVLLIVMVLAGTLTPVPASAQSSSGQFNPQTQFAVGTKLQITSIYGLESALNSADSNYGNHIWHGQNGNHTQTSRTGPVNQEYNLTYLRNTPTANSSIAINIQITNDTRDGGVLWTVQGGSITYNGTTLHVTNGNGGIGKLNRILMVGNATDSNGNALRWYLEGLTTIYNGITIVSLTGSVDTLNQNSMLSAQPTQTFTEFRVSLTYIATIN